MALGRGICAEGSGLLSIRCNRERILWLRAEPFPCAELKVVSQEVTCLPRELVAKRPVGRCETQGGGFGRHGDQFLRSCPRRTRLSKVFYRTLGVRGAISATVWVVADTKLTSARWTMARNNLSDRASCHM